MNNSWFWGMSSGCMALWDPWLWHDILLRASELPAEEHLLSTLRTHLMTIYAVRTCIIFCFSRKSFFFFKNFALSLCVSIKRQLPQTGWMDLEGCWGRRRWSGEQWWMQSQFIFVSFHSLASLFPPCSQNAIKWKGGVWRREPVIGTSVFLHVVIVKTEYTAGSLTVSQCGFPSEISAFHFPTDFLALFS